MQMLKTALCILTVVALICLTLVGCPPQPSRRGPTASFKASPTRGPAPLTVSFANTSRNGSACIVSWIWLFGDGGQSDAANPTYTFTESGTYIVSLTVRTSVGTDTAALAIVVTSGEVEGEGEDEDEGEGEGEAGVEGEVEVEGEGEGEGEGEPAPLTESPTFTFADGDFAKVALEDTIVSYVPNEEGTGFDLANVERDNIELVELDPADEMSELTDGTTDYSYLDFEGDKFTLYDEKYDGTWVGSKGAIAFGDQPPEPEDTHTETVGISALRAEFDPTLGDAAIASAVVEDTFVVDYEGLRKSQKELDISSFQIQGVLDGHPEAIPGTIDILYELVDAGLDEIIVGISSSEIGSELDINPNTLLIKMIP